jgi:hypothetical protein
MPRYITDNDVRVRLIGKVRFTESEDEENKMHVTLLKRLIDEAEGQVEYDLSPRYAAPFQTVAGGAFKTLPDRPTKELIRTLCELMAVIRVLETDFGRGTAVDGDKYKEGIQKRYDAVIGKLMERRAEGELGFKYPPLPSLMLNAHNMEADDGFLGQVLVTSDGDGAFPGRRINDPSETFFNADLRGELPDA